MSLHTWSGRAGAPFRSFRSVAALPGCACREPLDAAGLVLSRSDRSLTSTGVTIPANATVLVSRREDYVGKLLAVDAVPGVTEAALEAALATTPRWESFRLSRTWKVSQL